MAFAQRAAGDIRALGLFKRWFWVALSVFIFLWLCVAQRNLVTTNGYRLGDVQKEHRALANKNHYLKWALVRQVSLGTLEEEAKKQGWRLPSADEEILVIVSRDNPG